MVLLDVGANPAMPPPFSVANPAEFRSSELEGFGIPIATPAAL
jgi:hypothetical protein